MVYISKPRNPEQQDMDVFFTNKKFLLTCYIFPFIIGNGVHSNFHHFVLFVKNQHEIYENTVEEEFYSSYIYLFRTYFIVMALIRQEIL